MNGIEKQIFRFLFNRGIIMLDKLLEDCLKNSKYGTLNFKEIDIEELKNILLKFKNEGYLKEYEKIEKVDNIPKVLQLSEKAINEAYQAGIVSIADIYNLSLLNHSTSELFYLSNRVDLNDLQKLINSTEEKLSEIEKNTLEKVEKFKCEIDSLTKDSREKIHNLEEEANTLKAKLIEILGIFVTIFTLISTNIGLISILKDIETLFEKLSLILVINGSLMLVVLCLLFGIKLIIFEKKLQKITSSLLLLPIILIILGLLIS